MFFTTSSSRNLCWFAALTMVLLAKPALAQDNSDAVDFAHDILPVLKSQCAACHSNGVFKGGLSLETRGALLDSGVVEIGDRSESELWARITSDDPESRMPPEGDPLPAAQIAAMGQWIDKGLDWPAELTLKQTHFKRPLALDTAKLLPATVDVENSVDQLVHEYFKARQIEFPQPVDDRIFIRRLKLDLLGLLPTPDEVKAFEGSDDPKKHEKLVDDFLSRERDYADHWMSFWNDLLRNDYAGTGYIDGGRQQITTWLHRSLMENKPYDQFVRELIKPAPESAGFIRGIKWRGEVNASQIEPLQFSQNISQVFLGINMKCASCHDSFIDNWKLSDAYGLAAIVSDTPLEMHRCDVPIGQSAISKFVFPQLGNIDGSLPREQRLEQLADLMTAEKNGRFSRTIVNRYWQRLMGRGMVHPVDVMANEAWSEDLLNLLAVRFVAPAHSSIESNPNIPDHALTENQPAGQLPGSGGYDVKQLLKMITTSRIYRARVDQHVESTENTIVFRGIAAKRMTAEQFVDAVWTLTGNYPEQMAAAVEDSTGTPVRAALVQADLLMRSLGRPNREQVVTTRPAELSTLQALDLSNGELLNGWIQQGAKLWLEKQKEQTWTQKQLITELFLVALSRTPQASELKLLAIAENTEKRTQVEDLIWMIVMLPEFQLIQ